MTPGRGTAWILEQAGAAGFTLCGVAPAAQFPELGRLSEWLAAGYAGQMDYLADPRRERMDSVLAGARSLIVCGLLYNTDRPRTAEIAASPDSASVPRGWISRYAWGDDYHSVVGDRLERLVATMRAGIAEPFEARPYVDTGPLSERVAAKYAGLGWLGKNTCLIHPQTGSWLFLGVVITTLELEPTVGPGGMHGEVPQPDLCGQCTLCLDACPTGAFVEPGVMDARRCISYLTIEHRGSIPAELRPLMGAHVYGCDICQDVCPYNHHAPVTVLPEFQPRRLQREDEDRKTKNEERQDEQPRVPAGLRSSSATGGFDFRPPDLFAPPLEWLVSLSEEEYRRAFKNSAMKRAKHRGLVRNACIALGNSAPHLTPAARERVRGLLLHLSASPDPVIAEQAQWALERLH